MCTFTVTFVAGCDVFHLDSGQQGRISYDFNFRVSGIEANPDSCRSVAEFAELRVGKQSIEPGFGDLFRNGFAFSDILVAEDDNVSVDIYNNDSTRALLYTGSSRVPGPSQAVKPIPVELTRKAPVLLVCLADQYLTFKVQNAGSGTLQWWQDTLRAGSDSVQFLPRKEGNQDDGYIGENESILLEAKILAMQPDSIRAAIASPQGKVEILVVPNRSGKSSHRELVLR